jgi:hypothetical protein
MKKADTPPPPNKALVREAADLSLRMLRLARALAQSQPKGGVRGEAP